jgi:hypothetical protein
MTRDLYVKIIRPLKYFSSYIPFKSDRLRDSSAGQLVVAQNINNRVKENLLQLKDLLV